jgi:hypothetical protein
LGKIKEFYNPYEGFFKISMVNFGSRLTFFVLFEHIACNKDEKEKKYEKDFTTNL